MAVLNAYTSLNINNTDLNWYYQNFSDEAFYNNTYDKVTGAAYADTYIVSGYDGYYDDGLALGGSGFIFNAKGDIVGGTLNGMSEFQWAGGDYWDINGISVSAKAVYEAALTASNADDIAIISLALSGDDQLYLSDDADVYSGYAGKDRIYGYGGSDTLWGGAGNDALYGGAGHDILIGEAGHDVLKGNSGYDTFVFNAISQSATGAGRDVIADFTIWDDLIDLRGIDANTKSSGNQAFHFIGNHGFTGHAGELRFAKGVVSADVDGDGVSDFQIGVKGGVKLIADDFLL